MKFYAVRKGRKTGIFNTWEETKQHIDHYPGAEFKKFSSMDEALFYLLKEAEADRIKDIPEEELVIATVDGSYNPDSGEIGWAYVLTYPNGEEIVRVSGSIPASADVKIRNIAGELEAARRAVLHGLSIKPKVLVQYDYEGIERWLTGQWKAKTPLAQTYVRDLGPKYGEGQIYFKHVQAHHHELNIVVDNLARAACGCKTIEAV